MFCVFKQKTAYEVRISDWSSDVCSSDLFIRVATQLGAHAVTKALAAAGVGPRDVDLIVSTTITGLAVPSIEARIAAEIGLRDDIKRVPLDRTSGGKGNQV